MLALPLIKLALSGDFTNILDLTQGGSMKLGKWAWIPGVLLSFVGAFEFGNLFATRGGALFGLLTAGFIWMGGTVVVKNFPREYLPQLRPKTTPPALKAESRRPEPHEESGRWMQ